MKLSEQIDALRKEQKDCIQRAEAIEREIDQLKQQAAKEQTMTLNFTIQNEPKP